MWFAYYISPSQQAMPRYKPMWELKMADDEQVLVLLLLLYKHIIYDFIAYKCTDNRRTTWFNKTKFRWKNLC